MKASPLVAATGLLAMLFASTAALADPIGDWRVADGTATVRIRHCGSAFCGYIATTATPPGKDFKNPDPRKRNHSVIGLEILINMKAAGNNRWTGATYNAEDGQMYSAAMSMVSAKALKIQGCVPGSTMCGSETWSRVR
ncbi:DUF2147 domain-containing protein [Methylovirgula sp. HY1]|uniref:DUF2147 domain-containing protein n=1 Tax=Methylovirgula sp. HY1 TaxID=2822761 RepID=UPI001C5BB3E7|nr:DUF2147 domain-containing protein [Methylovirgula sp. HY1]QXX75155.1 hypothetical protein MHY1_01974 [Methylovirgula sp. HY1]